MSEWTEWSECNKSCGKGHTIRTRTVTLEPQFGGDTCTETIQRKKCKIRKCNRGQANSDEKKRRREQREKRRSKLGRPEFTSEHPGQPTKPFDTLSPQVQKRFSDDPIIPSDFIPPQGVKWDRGRVGRTAQSSAAAAFRSDSWQWSRGLRRPSCPAVRTGRRSGLVTCTPARGESREWSDWWGGGVEGFTSGTRSRKGDGTRLHNQQMHTF